MIIDHLRLIKKVMEDPEICKGVLERILGVKIGSVEYHESEKAMKGSADIKGIRLDVYLADGHTKYDIEMQTTPQQYLYNRSRYYLCVMEEDSLEEGKPYSDLGDNIVIFICLNDPFGLNLCRYTVRDHVDECLDFNLGTDTKKVFLNVHGDMSHESPEMVAFCNYIAHQEVPDGDELIKTIDKKVDYERRDPISRKEYINMISAFYDIRNEGKAEGKAEGERLQLITFVCRKKLKGMSAEEIVKDLDLNEDEVRDVCSVIDSLDISDSSEDSVNRIYDELQSGKLAKA